MLPSTSRLRSKAKRARCSLLQIATSLRCCKLKGKPLYKLAIAISEKTLGAGHPGLASSLEDQGNRAPAPSPTASPELRATLRLCHEAKYGIFNACC